MVVLSISASPTGRLRMSGKGGRRHLRTAPRPRGPTKTEKPILPYLPLSTEERAGNLIRECVARGTCHLRTHVDIDLESGLAKLEGVLAAREGYCNRATVQIVAFPQE